MVKNVKFQILTGYDGKQFAVFKEDIRQIENSLKELNAIAQSGAGVGKAAEEIKNFVKVVGGMRGKSLGTFKEIAAGMEQITKAAGGLGDVTKEVRSFANAIFALGKKVQGRGKDWEVGIENIKRLATVLRQLGGGGVDLKPLMSLVKQLKSGESSPLVERLLSLEKVVRWTGQIATNLAQIKGIGTIDIRYGGAGAERTGRRGAEAIATPTAMPAPYLFSDVETQSKINTTVEKLTAGPTAMGAEINNRAEISKRAITQISSYETSNVEQWRHIVEYTSKLLNIKKLENEDEAAYFARMRKAHEEAYGRGSTKGLFSASGLASVTSGRLFSGEYTPGKGAVPMEMAALRGTFIHKGFEESIRSLGVGEGGAIDEEFKKLIMRINDPKVYEQVIRRLRTTTEAAAKEFKIAAARAFPSRTGELPQWVNKEVDRIRRGIPETVVNFLRFLNIKTMERFKGGIREGVNNITIQLEQALKPVEIVSPAGPGKGGILARTRKEFRPIIKEAIDKLKRADEGEYKAFKKIADSVGIRVGGIADIIVEIGKQIEVLDIKTGGGKDFESIKYVLTQLRDVYLNMAKLMYKNPNVEGFVLTASGEIKSIAKLEQELASAQSKVGAAGKKGTIAKGGKAPGAPEVAEKRYLTTEEEQVAAAKVRLRNAMALTNEEVKQSEAARKHEETQKRLTEWTKEKRLEMEKEVEAENQLLSGRRKEAAIIEYITEQGERRVKLAGDIAATIGGARTAGGAIGGAGGAIGGAGGGGAGGGRPPEDIITMGMRARLGPGMDIPMPITKYEALLNKARIEAFAFGDALEIADVQAKLVASSISEAAGYLGKLTKLEMADTDAKLMKKHAAYERLTNILRRYTQLQEKLTALQKAETTTIRTLGTKEEYDKAVRILKKREAVSGGKRADYREIAQGSTFTEENLKRIDNARRKIAQLRLEAEAAGKEFMDMSNSMIAGFKEGSEPATAFDRELREIYKDLGITGEKVSSTSDALKVFTEVSRQLGTETRTSKEKYVGINKELDKLKIAYEDLVKGQNVHRMSSSKVAAAYSIMQKRLNLISKEYEKIILEISELKIRQTEASKKAAQTEGKTAEVIRKEAADAKKLRIELDRLIKTSEQLAERRDRIIKQAKPIVDANNRQRRSAEEARGAQRMTLSGFRDMLRSQAAWVAGYGLMFGAMRGLKEALGSVIDLQQQMARAMRTSRSEVMSSAQVLREYTDAAVDTMIRLGRTSEDVGEVLYQLGSAGLTSEQSIAALRETMNAIVGSEADVTTYTKAVAGAYNNFADTITEATTLQGKFKYINDLMVATFRDHQVEINELTEGLKHLAAMGKATGLTWAQMNGILGTLNDHMIKSGMAGRSVQSILSRISRQGREFAKAFDIDIDMTKPIDFIKILIDVNKQLSTGKLTGDEIGLIFEKLGLRGAKSFTILARNVNELLANISKLQMSAKGAAASMADIMTSTPEGELKKMGQLFAELTRQVTHFYVEVATAAATLVNKFVAAIRGSSEEIKVSNSIFKESLVIFKDFSITTLHVTTILTILAVIYKKLIVRYGAAEVASAGFLASIGATQKGVKGLLGVIWGLIRRLNIYAVVIGMIVGLSYALWKHFKNQTETVKELAEAAYKSGEAYKAQAKELQNLRDKQKAFQDIAIKYDELSESKKRSLMATYSELIDYTDQHYVAHMKNVGAINKEAKAIDALIEKNDRLARAKLFQNTIDNTRALYARLDEVEKKMKVFDQIKRIKEVGFWKGVNEGIPGIRYVQTADLKGLRTELEELNKRYRSLLIDKREFERRGGKDVESKQYKELIKVIKEAETEIDSLNRRVYGEGYNASDAVAATISDEYEDVARKIEHAKEVLKDFFNELGKRGAQVPEKIFKMPGMPDIAEQRKKGIQPADIVETYTALTDAAEKLFLPSALSELTKVMEDVRGKTRLQIEADKELLASEENRVDVAKTYLELIENGGNIQEATNKRIATVIMRVVQNELKLVNLNEQNKKTLLQTLKVINQIEKTSDKLLTAKIPAGYAKQVSTLIDQSVAADKSIKQTAATAIETLKQRIDADKKFEVDGLNQIRKIRKARKEAILDNEASLQSQLEQLRDKANKKYERSLLDRRDELEQVALQAKDWLTIEEQWRLKEISLEKTIRKTNETIKDLQYTNKLNNKTITELQGKYSALIETKDQLEAQGKRLSQTQQEELLNLLTLIAALQFDEEQTKKLIEFYKKLNRVREEGKSIAKDKALMYGGDAFKGAEAALKEWQTQVITFGKVGYDVVKNFAKDSEQAFSNIFYDGFRGKLKNLSDYWKATWDNMLKYMASILGQMAAKALVKPIVTTVASSTIGSGLAGFIGKQATAESSATGLIGGISNIGQQIRRSGGLLGIGKESIKPIYSGTSTMANELQAQADVLEDFYTATGKSASKLSKVPWDKVGNAMMVAGGAYGLYQTMTKGAGGFQGALSGGMSGFSMGMGIAGPIGGAIGGIGGAIAGLFGGHKEDIPEMATALGVKILDITKGAFEITMSEFGDAEFHQASVQMKQELEQAVGPKIQEMGNMLATLPDEMNLKDVFSKGMSASALVMSKKEIEGKSKEAIERITKSIDAYLEHITEVVGRTIKTYYVSEIRMAGFSGKIDLGKFKSNIAKAFEEAGAEGAKQMYDKTVGMINELVNAINPDRVDTLIYKLGQLNQQYLSQLKTAEELGISVDLVTEAYNAQFNRLTEISIAPVSLESLYGAIGQISELVDAVGDMGGDVTRLNNQYDHYYRAYKKYRDKATKQRALWKDMEHEADVIRANIEKYDPIHSVNITGDESAFLLALKKHWQSVKDDAQGLHNKYEEYKALWHENKDIMNDIADEIDLSGDAMERMRTALTEGFGEFQAKVDTLQLGDAASKLIDQIKELEEMQDTITSFLGVDWTAEQATAAEDSFNSLRQQILDAYFAPTIDIVKKGTLTKIEYAFDKLDDSYAKQIATINALKDSLSAEEFTAYLDLVKQAATMQAQDIIDNYITPITKEWEEWLDTMTRTKLAPGMGFQTFENRYQNLLEKARQGDVDAAKELMSYVQNEYLPFMQTYFGETNQNYLDLWNRLFGENGELSNLTFETPTSAIENIINYLDTGSPLINVLQEIATTLGSSNTVHVRVKQFDELLRYNDSSVDKLAALDDSISKAGGYNGLASPGMPFNYDELSQLISKFNVIEDRSVTVQETGNIQQNNNAKFQVDEKALTKCFVDALLTAKEEGKEGAVFQINLIVDGEKLSEVMIKQLENNFELIDTIQNTMRS